MKAAMRAKDQARLGTIRLLLAALKQKEVDERVTLTDQDIFSIINKMIKQRRESITQFQQGGRPELAEKENQEIIVLSEYLPKQLSDVEIDAMVEDAIRAAGAKLVNEMGSVMAIIKPELQGRADMAAVSAKVKNKLQSKITHR